MDIVKIVAVEPVTHDVKRFIVEKPAGFKFTPGQATEVSINQPDWIKEKRPFTFTCLNEDITLEFTIKAYPEHQGVTQKLHQLTPGDELIIRDPFGAIHYQGVGVFIAGGAGITPFIAILRDLRKKNEIDGNYLIFSNKTQADIILEQELRQTFPDSKNLIFTLTREKIPGYESGRIDELFLKKFVDNFSQNFYLCGPKPMVNSLKQILDNLGAKTEMVVFEE